MRSWNFRTAEGCVENELTDVRIERGAGDLLRIRSHIGKKSGRTPAAHGPSIHMGTTYTPSGLR